MGRFWRVGRSKASNRLLAFWIIQLGEEEYALPDGVILGIVPRPEAGWLPFAVTTSCLLGGMAWMGKVVPVMSPGACALGPARLPGVVSVPGNRVVMTSVGMWEGVVGLVVSDVVGKVEVLETSVAPIPPEDDTARPCCRHSVLVDPGRERVRVLTVEECLSR